MPASPSGDRPLFFCLMLLKCCAVLISTLLALNSEPFVCSFVNNQKGTSNKHCKYSKRTHMPSQWRMGKINEYILPVVVQVLYIIHFGTILNKSCPTDKTSSPSPSALIFQYLSLCSSACCATVCPDVHLLSRFKSLFFTSKHLPAPTDLLREVRY